MTQNPTETAPMDSASKRTGPLRLVTEVRERAQALVESAVLAIDQFCHAYVCPAAQSVLERRQTQELLGDSIDVDPEWAAQVQATIKRLTEAFIARGTPVLSDDPGFQRLVEDLRTTARREPWAPLTPEAAARDAKSDSR